MEFIKIVLLLVLIILLVLNLFKYGQVCKVIIKYVNIVKIFFKSKINIGIDYTILLLSKVNNRLIMKNDEEYKSLTPKDDLEKENSYIQALKEGIENPKRKNIAIAGIYGAGKSSIIESFKKHYKEYRYLDISLATFVSSGNDSLEEQLERNILNQIFYKVKHSKMPYSRFRKINNIKNINIFQIIITYFLLVTSSTLIIKPLIIQNFTQNINKLKDIFSNIPILKNNTTISVSIVIIISAITIVYVVSTFTKLILGKFTINSIQSKEGTVQVEQRNNEESFNKYLDEIMYFFEVIKYDVVFLEDLDRFDNIEIFTKLRELNNLINNSDSINRKVTFVYAIKDELFFIENDDKGNYFYVDNKKNNKNRTKFFDFIIPIIPIVNSENSYDVLKKEMDKFNNEYRREAEKGKVVSELINDISFFIDDMRLLTNIYNEFLIYYKRLMIEGNGGSLNVNNLLAIIVYKNVYPVDFTKLQSQQGMVYNVFNKKHEIIKSVIKELNENLDYYETNIKQLEKEIVENEEELNYLYLEAWKKEGINYVRFDNEEYNIERLNNINILKKVQNAQNIKYNSWNTITFDNLITVNGKKTSYLKRLTAFKSIEGTIKDKISYNKKQIEIIDKKIREIKDSSIETLMKDERFFNNLDSDIKQENLIIRLLKYGYINETYSSYIVYFYEGKFSKKDFEFIQSVIHNKPLAYNFELNNIKEILMKFRIEDFEGVSILNYKLIAYLIKNIEKENNKLKLEKIIQRLSELNDDYIKFIIDFLELNKDKDVSNFIRLLCKSTDDFWNKIFSNVIILSEQKDYILELILKYCNINEILRLNNTGNIKLYIESKEDFIETIAIKIETSKLEDIFVNLNIKLNNINEDLISKINWNENGKYSEIFNIIHNNNSYEINKEMLRVMILYKRREFGSLEAININYSSIKNYNLEEIICYIDENINIYLENIFKKVDIIEDSSTIIEFINNENVTSSIKNNIINQKDFKILNINEIEDIGFWGILLDNLRVNYSWENVLEYYKNKGNIDEFLSNFINKTEVYEKLKEDDLYNSDNEQKEIDEINLFVEAFVKSEKILDSVINLVSNKLGEPFVEFDFNDLGNDRVIILINKEIVTLTERIYKSLKNSHFGTHIKLIELHIEKFIDSKVECFDSKDFELVMKSSKISIEDKYTIFENYSNNIEIDEILSEIIFDTFEVMLSKIKLEYKVIDDIIKYLPIKKKKIKLLISQIDNIDKENIVRLLMEIDSDYNGLIDLSAKKMVLTNNYENNILLEALKSIGYISSFKNERGKITVHRKHK